MQWIAEHWEVLSLALVNLLALLAVLAKLTPTTTDDEWIAKIEDVVKNVVAKK